MNWMLISNNFVLLHLLTEAHICGILIFEDQTQAQFFYSNVKTQNSREMV